MKKEIIIGILGILLLISVIFNVSQETKIDELEKDQEFYSESLNKCINIGYEIIDYCEETIDTLWKKALICQGGIKK